MNTESELQPLKNNLPDSWGGLMALGFLMVVLGAIGLGMSFTFTITTVLLFGFFMLLSGITQLVHAVIGESVKEWKSKTMYAVTGALYVLGGLISIFNPVAASVALTILLAGMFLAIGVFRVREALNAQKQDAPWGALMFAGVTSLVFSAVIVIGMPWTALWVLGLLVAIELAMNGALLIGVALEKRKVEQDSAGSHQ